MGIQNKDGALYFATGIDNTGLYKSRREAIGIIKAMADEITSFDVFGGIGISAGIAFARAAKESYDFERRFQKAMLEVATLSKQVDGSMTEYMNRVMDMIRGIPIAGDEAAKALYQIVSAGHDGANGMEILEVSAKAATGSLTETATAADAITTILNAYGMQADKAESVSDKLFTTVRMGKTTFGELGTSIAQAAPIAASFGIDLDDVLAAVATITKQGVPTSEAMTKIRAAILGTANQLGDAAFQGRTFQEALQLIYDKADGSATKMKELLGTDEALQAALALTGKNAEGASKDLVELGNSAGAAEVAFKKMNDSAENQLLLLRNNITVALRPMGEAILKEVSDIASSFNEAFANGDVKESMKTLGALIVTITGGFVGYKGSIAAATTAKTAYHAITTWITKQKSIEAANLVLTKGLYATEATAIAKNAAMHTLLTNALKSQFAASMKAAGAVLANPYVLAAIAVAGLGYAVYSYSTRVTAAEKAQIRYNDTIKANQKQADEYRNRVNSLVSIARDDAAATFERHKALIQLQRLMPSVFKDMDMQKLKTMDQLELTNKMAEAETRRNVVVAKTNLVLAKRRLQELDNQIIKTDNAGGYTGALKEDRLAAIKEVELYQGVVDKIEADRVELAKAQAQAEAEASIKNKSYWEKQKKEAETALESIASAHKKLMDAGKFEGLDSSIVENYKTNIKLLKEAEKELKVYDDSSKQESAAEKLRRQQEDIRAQNDKLMTLESKQALERERQQQDLDNQLEQSRIDSLQDGYEKEQAQRELNNKKEIQALERQKEDYIRAYIQGQKEIFDAQEDLKAKQTKGYVKKSFDSSSISVDTSAFDTIIGNTKKRQSSDEIREQEASWNEYLIKFGNFQQKRKAIIDKYDQAIKEASNAGDAGMLEEEKRQQLNNLDEQYGKTTRSMADLFEDASNKSVSAIQSIIDKYETLIKYMSGTDKDISIADLKGMGFTDKDIERIEKGEISIKDVTDAIKGLKDELKGKSPWQAFTYDLDKGIKAIKDAGSDSKKLGQGITDIGNSIISFTPALNEFGSSITDIFGFDDSKITSAIDALGGLGQTASGVGQIMSGDIVGGAMSAVSGISAVVSALDGMFGADYSHYNEMVEEYNKLYEIWDELIDKKLEYIGISYGIEADRAGEEALSLVEKQIEAYRLLGKERLNSGASAGSHSIGKRMVKNTSSGEWQDIASALDMSVQAAKEFIGTGRMTGLFDLTTEQLEKLKSEVPAFWAKMDGDVQEYLNGIIEGGARIEDIQNQIKEQLTQTTFDSVFDSFVDTLMDMDSSAKDFSDSFSGYMQRAVLTTMVGNKFTEDLQTWYDAFARANKDQEGITKEEMEALREQYDAIAGSALAERDKLAEIFGWTKEDSDSSTDNYENFIGSMQDSLTSLDVTAKDVSDNIYDYFRQAMIKALYEKEYKGRMEELYKTFEELSKDGLSESDMVQLGSQVDRYIEQMMKGVEGVNSIFTDKLKDAEDLQSFVDNVKSAMFSIEATAEDITDNIFEYIRQQMVEKMFADTFQPQIEEFYKRVQKAMSDGDITDAERNTLRSEAEKLANDIVAAKDILSDTLGITESNMKKELEEEFKSFSDGILNSLTNAEVTAEAVAKNISESMRKELIEAMYIEQYEPRIKAIWEKWKEYSEDGLVTDEERANIKNDIDELSKEVADAAGEISDVWKDSGEEVRKAFDSFSDSIRSVLYDAEATAEDVANNIYKFMRNALVDSMFSAQLQPQIQAWYDQYTEFMKDGAIDTAERKTLDEMIAEIQKAGVDIVDAANKLFPTLDTGAINRAEEAAQEAENARNEAEQEWESFSDGILNSLYDIEATAEDISDDMSEYMRKALIKAMYVENFKPQMQKWYNEWKKAMGDDDLTSEEKQLLDSMKQTMVDDMKKEVDAINQFFGTMFSQQASSKGYETVSQDTGEEISGRATAIYESSEGIRTEAAITNSWLAMIYSAMGNQGIRQSGLPAFIPASISTLREQYTIGMQGDVLRRLEDIYKFNADSRDEYSDMMYSMIEHLEGIHKNTDCLPRMEKILKEVKQYSKALAGK